MNLFMWLYMSDPIIEGFRRKGCNYWEEQDIAYGLMDFKGKTLLNIGADCGTTVYYAYLKGIKHVIAYEKDPNLRKYLYSFPFVDVRGEWVNQYDNADLLIMDCEGCEVFLDLSQLNKYSQYCIAIHSWIPNFRDFLLKFRGNRLTYVTPDLKEFVLCKV
ncbi:SAM-dependent methyltransferase [Sulfolobus ellipsoid virus 1]|uniref:SAM-dependent methyltransferase n=1 Tax=Sulfolobus ellipsoid virus 1 TaxID=2056194 RepID=A0A2H4RBM0_9VIRU|nr:SAM-dependent methyltransferase [Sulfolobus ellipsoid virus 1]ATY46481.1 SAM-dependent methyltransferase [Sulfolobus ellipsoid virus 1]